MKIDSAPAKAAAHSANVAQANTKPATDGAPIHADAPEDSDGQLGVFQAIFQQLSQQVSTEKVVSDPRSTKQGDVPTLPNGNVATTNLPTLPNLSDAPPAAIVNQQIASELPVKDLPGAKAADLAGKNLPPESTPIDAVPAKPLPNLPANLKIDAQTPEVGETASEEVPEAKQDEEKPQKIAQVNCNSAAGLPSIPMQPIEIAKSSQPEDSERPQPVIQESNGKRKTVHVEKRALPKVKELDEVPGKEIQPRKTETDGESTPISQQLPEDIPVAIKDDSAATQQKKIDSPKLEFTLPHPHLAPKELDQPAPPPPLPPEQAFIQANHPAIVSTIHGELLPNGGSMHIRLDPPELGALNVQIDVRDGIVTASFQTSNDEATRLLSHSLGQLRTTLESAGISVEKLQVQQAPREHVNPSSRDSERSPQQQAYERSAHDDRQRREMLQRMWRRLTVGRDELDLVA